MFIPDLHFVFQQISRPWWRS